MDTAPFGGGQDSNPLTEEGRPPLILALGEACPQPWNFQALLPLVAKKNNLTSTKSMVNVKIPCQLYVAIPWGAGALVFWAGPQ